MLRSAAILALSTLLFFDDVPRLSSTEGAKVLRSWSLETVSTVESATLVLNEEDQDMGTGSTTTSTLSVQVTDTVRAAADGAPTKFHRAYGTIETESEIGGLEDSENMEFRDSSGSSELTNLGVEFEWDADAEEWAKAFDGDSSGDEDWLGDLDSDMDLTMILPSGDVGVGDSWEVPIGFIGALLRPGGDIDVRADEDGADGLGEGAVAIEIPNSGDIGRWHELEGTIEASYVEIIEEDGPRRARIVLEVDVEGEIDIAGELEDAAVKRGMDEQYSEATLTRTLEGEITVEWDLAAGRFATVLGKLEGTTEFYGDWVIAIHGLKLGLQVDRKESVEMTISASNS